jgi:hypothetical protein
MRLPEASNTAAAGIGKEEGGMEMEAGRMERGEEDGGSEEITVRPPPPALTVSHEHQEEDWRSGTSEFLANSEGWGSERRPMRSEQPSVARVELDPNSSLHYLARPNSRIRDQIPEL